MVKLRFMTYLLTADKVQCYKFIVDSNGFHHFIYNKIQFDTNENTVSEILLCATGGVAAIEKSSWLFQLTMGSNPKLFMHSTLQLSLFQLMSTFTLTIQPPQKLFVKPCVSHAICIVFIYAVAHNLPIKGVDVSIACL